MSQTMSRGRSAPRTRPQPEGFLIPHQVLRCRMVLQLPPRVTAEAIGRGQRLGISPWESSARWSFWIRDEPETHPCWAETCSQAPRLRPTGFRGPQGEVGRRQPRAGLPS